MQDQSKRPDPGEGYELVIGESDGTEEVYLWNTWYKSIAKPGEWLDYNRYYHRRKKSTAKQGNSDVAFAVTVGGNGQPFQIGPSVTIDSGSECCTKESYSHPNSAKPWLSGTQELLREPQPGEDCYFREEKYKYVGRSIDGSIVLETYNLDPQKQWHQRFETSDLARVALYPFRDVSLCDRKFRIYLIDGRPAVVELSHEN